LIAKPYNNPPARSAKPINALINTQNRIPNLPIPSLPIVLFHLHFYIHIPLSFSDTKFGKPIICGKDSKSGTDIRMKTVLQFHQ
jgi:hypothetical protein